MAFSSKLFSVPLRLVRGVCSPGDIVGSSVTVPRSLSGNLCSYHSLQRRICSPPASQMVSRPGIRGFHSTSRCQDLMEFFDDRKQWGAKEVRSGRSWTKDDLRLKSNSDLHKLWFILYKERNMLYTMQHEYKRDVELFANPERIDKVEESMLNLETVVEERDRASKLLELGVTGEAPKRTCWSGLGLRYKRTYEQHLMPYWRNPSRQKSDLGIGLRQDVARIQSELQQSGNDHQLYLLFRHFAPRHIQPYTRGTQRWFLLRYWEKNRGERNKQRRRQMGILKNTRREYPDDPIWQEGKPLEMMKLSDAFHGKMSD